MLVTKTYFNRMIVLHTSLATVKPYDVKGCDVLFSCSVQECFISYHYV